MHLRDYQQEIVNKTFTAWNSGSNNVLAVQPTGTGKTVVFCSIIKELFENHKKVCVIAHRKELVSQISVTLGKYGIHHSIIAPRNTIMNICKIHYEQLKKCFYNPHSNIVVSSVKTLLTRNIDFSSYEYWIIDEAHHVLRDNTWGKAVNLFKNAKGLGVTATPCRTDKRGLGVHASGVFDILIDTGKDVKWYIHEGYLSKYKIYFPGKYIDMTGAKRGSDGDWSLSEIVKRTEKAEIVGDIVQQYLKVAKGKRGLTFMPSIKLCEQVVESFKLSGVPAVSLNGSSSDNERFKLIDAFRNGEILQIVNVDLFSEGFDLPAVECISMGRKTASFGWYRQVIGRVLRPFDGKEFGIINDHVGNVLPQYGGHGLPDQEIVWSLDDGVKKSKSKNINITKVCAECTAVYSRLSKQCPYCGHIPEIKERLTPEIVDGDLIELDEETISMLRSQVISASQETPEQIRNKMLNSGASPLVANSVAKNKRLEIGSRNELRSIIKNFQIKMMDDGESFSDIYKRFYKITGFDMISALAVNRKTTEQIIEVVLNEIRK
jgi:superfamily II DNA or RNA helicase